MDADSHDSFVKRHNVAPILARMAGLTLQTCPMPNQVDQTKPNHQTHQQRHGESKRLVFLGVVNGVTMYGHATPLSSSS